MLSDAQQTAFRAAVKAHVADAVATAYAGHDVPALAAFYNAPANPAVLIWRPDVKGTEISAAILMTEFLALSLQFQNGVLLLTQGGGGIVDTTDANVRAGFAALFPANSVSRPALVAKAQRNATAFEAVFTSGGVCSLYGYKVTDEDVRSALWDRYESPR